MTKEKEDKFFWFLVKYKKYQLKYAEEIVKIISDREKVPPPQMALDLYREFLCKQIPE